MPLQNISELNLASDINIAQCAHKFLDIQTYCWREGQQQQNLTLSAHLQTIENERVEGQVDS